MPELERQPDVPPTSFQPVFYSHNEIVTLSL